MSSPPPRDEPPMPSDLPPIAQGRALSDEQKRLLAFFVEAEQKQLDFLDEAGKRIIELITLVLGALFTVTAIGKDFPPPYLKDSLFARLTSVGALALYVVALWFALRTVQLRNYKLYRANLSAMREEFDKLVATKKDALWWAGLCFWLGSLLVALLVGSTILRF